MDIQLEQTMHEIGPI